MSGDPAPGETRAYKDGFVTVSDGLRLHYRDYPGSAGHPPILCLPGLTRNARDFAQFAERYSPRFRVIALDFRGRAESDYDPQPSRYQPLTYAQDVIELLGHLQVDKAVFVGTSLGGLVTMTIAALAPQLIAGAILNDIGPEIARPGIERIKSYVGGGETFATWDEAAAKLAANNAGSFDHYTQDHWLRMAKRACCEEGGAIRFDYDPAIALPFNSGGETPRVDMWPLFAALAQKPLLVIRGGKSDLFSAETTEKMQAAAPEMRLTVVPGVGHAPDLDEPEAIAAIDEFLDGMAGA